MDFLTTAINKLRESIAYLTNELASCTLDGTPYLLVCTVPGHTPGAPDVEVVYGRWDGRNCFKAIDTVQDHLCGTIQMSARSLDKNIAQVMATGFVDGTKPIKAYGRHWRDEYARRLVNYTNLVEMVGNHQPVAG